jgi:AcrR family transcriptional regulator
VYRYFAKLEDLRFAVLETNFEVMDQHLPAEVIAAGVGGLARTSRGRVAAPTREMLERARDLPTLAGPASASAEDDDEQYLLRASLALLRAAAMTDVVGSHEPALRSMIEVRWVAPLRALGLGERETEIVFDCMLAVLHRETGWSLAGDLDEAERDELFTTSMSALIRGLAARGSPIKQRRGTAPEPILFKS